MAVKFLQFVQIDLAEGMISQVPWHQAMPRGPRSSPRLALPRPLRRFSGGDEGWKLSWGPKGVATGEKLMAQVTRLAPHPWSR